MYGEEHPAFDADNIQDREREVLGQRERGHYQLAWTERVKDNSPLFST